MLHNKMLVHSHQMGLNLHLHTNEFYSKVTKPKQETRLSA